MSTAAYRPSVSFVPARKWDDRAEELLKDPDAYYRKLVQPPRSRAKPISLLRRRRQFWQRDTK